MKKLSKARARPLRGHHRRARALPARAARLGHGGRLHPAQEGPAGIDYFHPDLKACLEPTYGVIVYQEQVMQISPDHRRLHAQGGADMLRRAMGKKKPTEMAKHRATIAEGAKQKGYDPALAEQLFDLMTKFAEYGFNKSHRRLCGRHLPHRLAQGAPLRAFMAATMSSDLDNTDTVKIFYEDTLANGIKVLPPDATPPTYRFVPVDRKTIRYGLGAVKGVRAWRCARSSPRGEGRRLPRSVRFASGRTGAW